MVSIDHDHVKNVSQQSRIVDIEYSGLVFGTFLVDVSVKRHCYHATPEVIVVVAEPRSQETAVCFIDVAQHLIWINNFNNPQRSEGRPERHFPCQKT